MFLKFTIFLFLWLSITWNLSLSLPTNTDENSLNSLIENRITKLLDNFKQELISEVKEIVSFSLNPSAAIVESLIGNNHHCLLKNRRFPEYFYAAEGFDRDPERRRTFTWIPGNYDYQCLWQFERHQTNGSDIHYKIKSVKYNEYLYAGADDLKYDEHRREIFTWKPKTQCEEQCYWDIQLVKKNNDDGNEKYFTIRNTEYGEYLYAMDGSLYDSDRRRAFTWKFNLIHDDVQYDNQSHWIIDCN